VYFASGTKCGLSMPLTSGELAGGKLLPFLALHSSSLALEKGGLSLTGGGKREREKRRKREGQEGGLKYFGEKKEKKKKRHRPLLLMHLSAAGWPGCIRRIKP